MASGRELIYHISEKYKKAELDFYTALKIWDEENLGPGEIRDQIRFDVKEKISSSDSVTLFNLMKDIVKDKNWFNKYASMDVTDYKLKTARYIPFTAEVRDKLIRISDSKYRHKNSSIDIEWVLVEKVGNDGKKVMYLARRELPKKIAAQVMEDSTTIDITSGTTLRPMNCPGIITNKTDYQKDENGNPCCILRNEKCRYLGNSQLSVVGNERDITCNIEIPIKR